MEIGWFAFETSQFDEHSYKKNVELAFIIKKTEIERGKKSHEVKVKGTVNVYYIVSIESGVCVEHVSVSLSYATF